MRFGRVPLAEAQGAVLAHTLRLPTGVLKKGHRLSADDVARLADAGHAEVVAARLDPGDVGEDEAADAVARAFSGPGLRVAPAATGRCNLLAEQRGLALVDRARIDALNAVDPALTCASLAPEARVDAGQIVATFKVIPFAVPRSVLEAARAAARGANAALGLAPLRARRAGLVLTRLEGTKESVLDQTARSQRARLTRLGGELARELRCPHREESLAAALRTLLDEGCDPILISGASAIVDPRDVIPAAIEAAGGVVDHFGMPVDPGNLLLLAHCGSTPVIGLPGCARSLKPSGFDRVLQRLCADLPVTSRELTQWGVGGLLQEIPSRPQPREALESETARVSRRVAALVLGAGSSQRMGSANKLIASVGGQPLVARVVDALLASSADPVVVVTGHEAEPVRGALASRPVRFVHNAEHAEGLGASIRAGIATLGDELDGVLVCLGDMAWVRPSHIEALLDAFDPRGDRDICVPVYNRKRGHPVLFAARYFPELLALSGDEGARGVLEAHADRVHGVSVADDAVIRDVDTPEALERLREELDAGP